METQGSDCSRRAELQDSGQAPAGHLKLPRFHLTVYLGHWMTAAREGGASAPRAECEESGRGLEMGVLGEWVGPVKGGSFEIEVIHCERIALERIAIEHSVSRGDYRC